MIRRDFLTHAVGAFLVVTVVLIISGATGALLFDMTIGGIHSSDEIGRVAIDGAVATLIFAYPAPFLLSAISAAYTARRVEQ